MKYGIDNNIDGLIKIGAIKFGKFTLASGKESNYYIDIKHGGTQPDILREYAALSMRKPDLDFDNYQRLAAVPVGAVALNTALSLQTGIPQLIVRPDKKEHGTKKQIEGHYEPGDRVLVVEDVATTGASSLKTADILRNAELTVEDVYVWVNREEGAEQLLADNDLKLHSLLTASSILKKQNP
jgi:orotate phosphoribosyltransferase